ncbi:MAG: hypothetical protein M1826_000926 [Phylliscum demangeonii]|nr:MAG: hypothetical protein M1826_000926 [Phylliscum demangeonii]
MGPKRNILKSEDPPVVVVNPALPEPGRGRDAVLHHHPEAGQPLAPPPRPAPSNLNATDPPDYFSAVHHPTHFSLEPNPFEQSFGGGNTTDTPGKSMLPSVAALTSPASLLAGTASAGFHWSHSLRAGPLSPAMLPGPTGAGDYFDGQLRASFPTPNESSLRTGLTPGAGGSMFPAPSPNTQALFQQLASGGATPSTLDFHRTAIHAAAARKADHGVAAAPLATAAAASTPAAASAPSDPAVLGAERRPPASRPPGSTASAAVAAAVATSGAADPFGAHDANDAANGLFMLAQSRHGSHAPPSFAAAERPANGVTPAPASAAPPPAPALAPPTPPVMAAPAPSVAGSARAARPSMPPVRGSLSGSGTGLSERSGEFSDSGASEPAQPPARTRSKKASAAAASGRRKAEAPPATMPARKRVKAAAGVSMPRMASESPDEMMMMEMETETVHANGRKMTDEEKRRNFLERNRVAALKCRQRKKQWLANLQAKVEIFSSENDALSAQVTQLREEILNLKTLLLAHKDCPVSQAQGLSSIALHGIAHDYPPNGPYGMAMPTPGAVMAGRDALPPSG